MSNNNSLYRALEDSYNVARDIVQKLETECLQGGALSTDKQSLLSGAYSAMDFFANLIAKLGIDNEEGDVILECPRTTLEDYRAASDLMKEYASILESDLCCDTLPNCVDYMKVHFLVGLRAVYEYIDIL